jgi:hypothetical protein
MPLDTCQVLNNFDIDKSTQKLICRHPFFPYTDLGSWPSAIDFHTTKAIQYTVGIVRPQRNTMVILRSNLPSISANDPNLFDWQIWDNAPKGGNGNDFVRVGYEFAKTHCNPEPVLGKVRLPLGNADNYRIFLPHQKENGDPILKYFPDTQGDYLVTDFSTDFVGGQFFKEDVATGITKSSLYMDGRPYSFLNRADVRFSASTYRNLGAVLQKGVYSFLITPVFDSFPNQHGAAFASVSARVTKEPKEEASVTTNRIERGHKYQVKKVDIYGWVALYQIFLGGFGPFSEVSPQGYANKYRLRYYYASSITPDGQLTQPGQLWMSSDWGNQTWTQVTGFTSRVDGLGNVEVLSYYFMPDPDAEVVVEYNGTPYRGGETFWVLDPPPDEKVTIILYRNGIEKHRFDITGGIPYFYLDQPVDNPNYPLLFRQIYHENRVRDVNDPPVLGDPWVNNTPGSHWFFFSKDTPLIEALLAIDGEVVKLEIVLPLRGFNPRILEFNIFSKREDDLDYFLLKKVKFREDSISDGAWGVSRIGSTDYARLLLDIDDSFFEKSFETWGALYDTDGNGFRPTSHTEEDITRRMVQMVAMRDRMFAIGIDGDQGQEIVGRTPISNGQAQHDIFYRPLISHAGKGKAVNYGIEFQDRLVWFQDTSIINGSFGDSRRQGDFYFHSTGDGVGTKLFRTIGRSNNAVFFANYDGIFRFGGDRAIDITIGRINSYWRYEVTKAQKDASFGAYNAKTNEYWLYVPPVDMDAFSGSLVGIIWIWDDNDYPGQHWRTYTLGNTPSYFFYDPNSNFVFVDSMNNLYFWPGENIATNPVFPIDFEMQTQNFNERKLDIIPDEIKLVRENDPVGNMNVNIFRNNSDQTEQITYTPPGVGRQSETRRLDKRRSKTLRLGIDGVYTYTADHLEHRPEINELTFSFTVDKKRT